MTATISLQLTTLDQRYVLVILFLTLLAMILIIWRRWQSRRQLLARVQELEALSEAGRAIVEAQLSVAALCELLVVEFGKVIDNRTFQIGLFEGDQGAQYRIMIWRIEGVLQEPRTFDLEQNSGLVGWVRDHKAPLLINDFLKEIDRLPARPRYISTQPPRSALFIPLIAGEDVIGIVAAQSAQPRRFDADDARRLSILTNQAAAAIMNARLFEEEKNRSAQLQLVGEIARKVNELDDLDEILRSVVRLVPHTLGFEPIGIFHIDEETGAAILQASSAEGEPAGAIFLPAGSGLIGAAAAQRQTIVANRAREDDRFVAELHGLKSGTQLQTAAEIVLPMVVQDELMGILDVQSEFENAFDQQARTVLEALGAQIGTAIFRANQLVQQRELAWLTAAQLQVADAISRTANLEELLSSVTRLTTMLVGAPQCGILLWNPEQKQYEGAAYEGAEEAVEQRFRQTILPIGAWGPIDAVHVGMELYRTEKAPPWNEQRLSSGELLLLPLVARGSMLAIMVVQSMSANPRPALSSRQIELVRDIANQTALGIESNILSEAQQEEAWVNTALFQVAEAISSLIDLEEILDTIVRFVPMLVGVHSTVVLVWDEQRRAFHAGPSYGISEMGRGLLSATDIESSEFVSVVEQEPDELAPSTTHYSVRLPPWLEQVMHAELVQAFPLHARGDLVGVLIVGPTINERPLSGRRLSILTGIAHQAAIAVVNDQLYREAAARERLEKELDVARTIQRSLIPNEPPSISGCQVAAFWEAARQVSGDFYDFLSLPQGQWGIVIADVADKGVPAALFMALSRTILRSVAFNRQMPGPTLERVNDLIFSDNQSDLFVTMFYSVWDPAGETLSYANAGHNPPLLLTAAGQVRELQGDGIALGVISDVTIEEKKVRLEPGDVVVFYTDGVTEAMNEDYDEFGVERLRLATRQVQQLEAVDIVDEIMEAVADHTGETPQFDDITLVVFKRTL